MTTEQTNAIVLLTPDVAIQQAKAAYEITRRLREEVFVNGIDFGTIPGTDKPTLYKPGAEKSIRAFGYCPVFETVSKVEQWDDTNALFHYEIRCRLVRIEDGKEIATGIGSCNSKENRYRWRWVAEDEVPAHLDTDKLKTRSSHKSELDFAIEQARTTGDYGKPAEYWNEWKAAIKSGAARSITRKNKKGEDMRAWEMGSLAYRIPNDEVFTLVNTVQKMACKRALVAAVLIGTNASEFFTQDIEDLRDFGDDVVEGVFEVVEPPKQQQKPATVEEPPVVVESPVVTPQNPYAAVATKKVWNADEVTSFWKQATALYENSTHARNSINKMVEDGVLIYDKQTVAEALDIVRNHVQEKQPA